MMNGYSVDEVDDFLDDLTVDYSKNYKELTELRSKVDELNNSLAHYKSIESTFAKYICCGTNYCRRGKKCCKTKSRPNS